MSDINEEGLALQSRLRASRLKYHYHRGGEVIGKACTRCGASGEYFWALGPDGKYATTEELYPFVLFKVKES